MKTLLYELINPCVLPDPNLNIFEVSTTTVYFSIRQCSSIHMIFVSSKVPKARELLVRFTYIKSLFVQGPNALYHVQ